ncbi:hypothetical protein BS50DRAFT_417287 [Corynespora cassiicola Philippines]|uniref:Uncharacterized protein n=1 Tax=Corynespora cassiicola Philippines TaxID=1448308 RepID=A0A2T2NME0_CORCC|nr:hypothetical protein BS50DRAFT_417287 [Corynespora cassiicola Philippines]
MCPRACVCMCTVLHCCTRLPHPFLTKGGSWTWAAFCLPTPTPNPLLFFLSYTPSPYASTVGRLLYVGLEDSRGTFRSITLILPHHLPTYPFRFEYPQMEPHSAYMRKGGHNRPPRRTTRKNNTVSPSGFTYPTNYKTGKGQRGAISGVVVPRRKKKIPPRNRLLSTLTTYSTARPMPP